MADNVGEKVNMSLDDLIKTRPKPKPKPAPAKKKTLPKQGVVSGKGATKAGTLRITVGGGVGKKKAGRGAAVVHKEVTKAVAMNAKLPGSGFADKGGLGISTGTKLEIRNLDFGVTDSDVKQVFEEIGKVKKSGINYNAKGKSSGTGFVIFVKESDAVKAYKKYHGERLDGRPMQISFVGGVAPALPTKPAPVRTLKVTPRTVTGVVSTRGRATRGRGRGSRSAKGRPTTAEGLDKELANYMGE